MDDADRLKALLKRMPRHYPEGIRHAEMLIRGPAFFPGGTGILAEGNQAGRHLHKGGIMVVAHNFGTIQNYERAIAHGREDDRSPTWQALIPFLAECGIDPLRCFFTNALVGVLDGGSSIGCRREQRDTRYRAACADVLRGAMALQQPTLILACGI